MISEFLKQFRSTWWLLWCMVLTIQPWKNYSSAKEVHIDFIQVSTWPWVTDPDLGSCLFSQRGQKCIRSVLLKGTSPKPQVYFYDTLQMDRCGTRCTLVKIQNIVHLILHLDRSVYWKGTTPWPKCTLLLPLGCQMVLTLIRKISSSKIPCGSLTILKEFLNGVFCMLLQRPSDEGQGHWEDWAKSMFTSFGEECIIDRHTQVAATSTVDARGKSNYPILGHFCDGLICWSGCWSYNMKLVNFFR